MRIKGETVTVEKRVVTGYDDYNNPVYSYTEQTVENVVVIPKTGTDVSDSTRPEGEKVLYRLLFPKTFQDELAGLRVKVRNQWLNVIGAPHPYTIENCPTDWNYTVDVGAVNG